MRHSDGTVNAVVTLQPGGLPNPTPYDGPSSDMLGRSGVSINKGSNAARIL